MSGKLVLVTGVTGFVGGHVAKVFLEAGYRVRGTTRGEKVKLLTDTVHLPGLEFTRVDDLATSDLTEALKGVYAVIHVASPLSTGGDAEEILNGAIEGTLHVLEATVKAGIEKIVITGSIGSIMDPPLKGAFGQSLTCEEWGHATLEESKQHAEDTFYVYFASKILSERAVWKFAKEHPEIDVATVLPGLIYGPYAEEFPFPSQKNLGTNIFMFLLGTGQQLPPIPPAYVDVRDVAQAHLAALDLPRRPLEEKRYVLLSGGSEGLLWEDAVGYLNKRRPDIKTVKVEELAPLPGPPSTYDISKTNRDLKVKWTKSEDTVVDCVESILKGSKTWAA